MITYRQFEIDNTQYTGLFFHHPDKYDVDHDGERWVGNMWGGYASTVDDAKDQIDEIWYEHEPHWFDEWTKKREA